MRALVTGTVLRAVYGVLALVLPRVLFPAGPLSYEKLDTEARYFNRLFGGRDIAIALVCLGQIRGGRAGAAWRTNMLCELTDTVSLVEEARARRSPDPALIIGLLFNLVGYRTWATAGLSLRARGRAAQVSAAPAESASATAD